MLINRWQAPIQPNKSQLKLILENEGLEPIEENYPPNTKIPEHRHPFDEVRFVAEGEILFSVAGTQLLLRSGDRIEIPANTKHWQETQSQNCVTIYAQRGF